MKPLLPRIPSATYRLQFHAGFTFRDALKILDYLDELGISDIYASPIFQANPGSTHGYDVANYNAFSPAVGSEDDFRLFVAELRRRKMGLVLDFVPNHMGINQSLNLWWMEVLEDGSSSAYARYFDIDWHPGKEALAEKVMLPILGKRYGEALEEGELRLSFKEGAFFLHYFETRLPIRPSSYPIILRRALPHVEEGRREELRACIADFGKAGKGEAKARLKSFAGETPAGNEAIRLALEELAGRAGEPSSFDDLHALLECQVYRLCFWRVAAEEINYRRFFDINTLAAIRVELPEVFDAAHRFLFDLLAHGDVTGLRIDHVDGLWNPKEYFERLQKRYAALTGTQENRGLYLVVEKILDASLEELPGDWLVHGTTGYEFANQVVQLFTDSSSEERLTKTYQRFVQNNDRFTDLVYEKKLFVMEYSFASEIVSLGRELDQLSELHRRYRDFSLNTLTKAVREVMACFPVYRTYFTENEPPGPQDERVILQAFSVARRRNPLIEKAVFDFLRSLLLMRFPEGLSDEEKQRHVHFIMRFQQCTGPVMAKGLEDTTLYLYHRLTALNEVGGKPGCFGLTAGDFHRLNAERKAAFPHGLLATTTHDTKRSEDVRMRMVAISEMPAEWRKAVARWSRMNRRFRVKLEDDSAPSPNEEYLLYQTLLGTWPLEPWTPENRREYTTRIQQYLLKALKEGKVNSSWTDPNEEWEQAVSGFIAAILDEKTGARFQKSLSSFAETIARLGAWNSLAETALKCTLPGVPDLYQGTEIWDLSLVDPDNRRPVDYGRRQELIAASGEEPGELLEDWKSGRIKLFVLQRLLRFRREHAEFFRAADYQPVEVQGEKMDHAVAFLRSHQNSRLLVVTGRLFRRLQAQPWTDESLLSESLTGEWRSLLTGASVSLQPERALLAELLGDWPFAVWFQPTDAA